MTRRKATSKGRPAQRRPAREVPARKLTALDEVVEVRSLAAGGDGVARLADGRVVFVRLAAPGDRLRLLEAEEAGSFLRAETFELVESGPARRTPACAVFGRCGGCAWQHIDASAQQGARERILFDALSRIGKFAAPPEIEFVASPEEFAYRGRTRVLVQGTAVGFRRHRSHEIEPVEHCPVLRPELDEALREFAMSLREGAATGATDARPDEEAEYELALSSDGSVRTSRLDPRDGHSEKIEIAVGGERLKISAGGFAQANPLLFDAMFDKVVQALGSGSSLLELYAGSGFFTVGLARRFGRVRVIESNREACRDLASNLLEAQLDNVEIHCARVENHLDAIAEERPDALLLDPPRSGLPRGAAARLAALGAQRVAYLSCDPATLARDLAVFCTDEGGYRLTALTAFDLFPQTPHVETLAVLDRRE